MGLESGTHASSRLTASEVLRTLATFFIYIPVTVAKESVDYVFRKQHWKPFTASLVQALHMCFAANMPVRVVQKLANYPNPDIVRNSTRYSPLKGQILERVQEPGFAGYWICRGLDAKPIEAKDADLVIFYIHGGGYIMGNPCVDAPNLLFVAEELAKNGIRVAIFGLDYTLVPEATFPHQVNETSEAYRWITNDLEVHPSKVLIMGESAGGHLTLSFLVTLHLKTLQTSTGDKHPEKPAYVFLISPWCDLHNSNPKVVETRSTELNFKRGLTIWGDLTLQELSSADRKIYLNFAKRVGERGSWKYILPQIMWVSAGTDEVIFVHDIDDFVEHAKQDGVAVLYELEEGGTHAWQTASANPQQHTFLSSEPGSDNPTLLDGYRRFARSVISVFKSEGYTPDGAASSL
ncbi:alpha/beta hydrolase fold protein [Lipomyces starkeyi]